MTILIYKKTLDDSQAGMKQIECSLSSEEAYGSLRASISKIKAMGLRDPLFSPEVALKVMTYLCHIILSFIVKLFENLTNVY